MFNHIVVGTSDMERAKKFYDAVLGTLGYGKAFPRTTGDFVYPWNDGFFIVTRSIDGRSTTHLNSGMATFVCKSVEQVDRWHAAGVANGGRPTERPLGVHETQLVVCTAPICAIRMATGSAPCIKSRPDPGAISEFSSLRPEPILRTVLSAIQQ
jgi:catechol 2,3-dioxygenase-like lactoylglutathione lyase family enzyme